MSGLEILGGVAAAASLTKVVGTFILKFGTRQNAPRQVKRLESILEDLNDRHLIEVASQREKERLWELILVAEETLKDHIKSSQPNVIVKFFWPEDAEKKLEGLNNELHGEWMRLVSSVNLRYIHRTSTISPITPITLGTPTSSSTLLHSKSPPQSPPASNGYLSPQTTSSKRSGRPPDHGLANPAPITSSSNSKGYELPATLYLQDPYGVNAPGIPPLKVKYLRVLERDESTRLIHYERKTANHHLEVTHRIPRSCLRFEDDQLSDTQIHFLDAHPITVMRSGTGHEVLFLHAKYEFTSVKHREEFISRMLERELLGRFYAQEIWYRGVLHAQGKVLRLWRKTESASESGERERGDGKMVTKLTYLAREERQWEGDLETFDRRVEVDETAGRVTLVEKADERSTLAIKFAAPLRARKQSASVQVLEGTTTAKKRERTLSSQTMVSLGAEDKATPSKQPERKKSTWSISRRWSKASVGSLSKETLSPELGPGLMSPDSLSPTRSSAVSSPALSHASDLTEDNSHSSSNGGNTNETQKSDAERFRDLWKKYHPSSVQQFVALPPIVTSAPIGLGSWDGLGGGDPGVQLGDYLGVQVGNSMEVPRSPSTSPRGTPALTSGYGSRGTIDKETGSEGLVNGGGAGIRPRLESWHPP